MNTRHLPRTRHLLESRQLSRRQLVQRAAIGGAGLALATAPARRAFAAQEASGDVTYWHHFTSETENIGLERVMASFEEAYPDINLIPENIPNADFMAKFTSAALADGLPDTTMVASDRLQDMVAMEALVPINERLDNWELKQYFPENVWTGATVDDNIYGIPAFMFVNWMYYRQDWFEEAGLAGPPTTWEEFEEAAIALTDPARGRYGFGLRGGDGGEGYLIDVISSFGPTIIDENGCADFDKEAATEALTFYAGLLTEHEAVPPSSAGDSYRQVMEAFRTGQTGMVLHHTGSLKEITDALGDKVMTAPVPAGPAAHIARVSPLYNGMAAPENEDAAWAWLTQWAEVDAEIAFLAETGYFPPNLQASEDPRVTENAIYDAATATLEFGTLPPSLTGYPGWAKQVVLPALQEVLIGNLEPADAVETMAAGLEEITGC